MIKLVNKYNTNNYIYDQYLNDHITAVKRTWYEIIKPKMISDSNISDETLEEISDLISCHDNSKFDDEEYYDYLDYFYPTENCPKDETAFKAAWNHHQKCNPHHWQYWIVISDDGSEECIDMPFKYVIEMCCDWHSFSLKNPESTAYHWWKDNKDKIKVSEKTSRMIDSLIVYLKDPLKKKDIT